jgi:hypothetical protein
MSNVRSRNVCIVRQILPTSPAFGSLAPAMKVFVVLLTGVLLLSSCSSIHTQRDPRSDLDKFQHFYVEHRLSDDRFIDEAIVAELKALGRDASAGPRTMMPQSADAIVTYQDEWAWDFKSYLIQLNIQIRDSRRERIVATGNYQQPSMFTKKPNQVVHAILRPLLKPR